MARKTDQIAVALESCLISPNCPDSNLEPANIVDAFYVLARTIDQASHRVAEGLHDLAQAIREKESPP